MIVFRIAAFFAGAYIAISTLGSAIATVVVPRGIRLKISHAIFRSTARLYSAVLRRESDAISRDQKAASFPAVALMLLPIAWVALVIIGFALMFWALGVPGPRDALELSGSSVTTLGFFPAPDAATTAVAVFEATVGLGVVALLISFLPTMYGQFSEREVMVSLLRTRAGAPPDALTWLKRAHTIGWIGTDLDRRWLEWERWFVQLEESHTSYPALTYFRSQVPHSSWITSAGAVLDTAALRVAVIDASPAPEAQICLRSGFIALRSIAQYFEIEFDPDPQPDDPITISRSEFDAAVDDLAEGGVPVKEDRDQAWADFAGWRVNYDRVLVAICMVVRAPYAQWSSDRTVEIGKAGRRYGWGKHKSRVPPIRL
ncbi:MAG: hypothetical protein KDB86_03865 [Actinobacteria bacterium]|nr:hypothetical protein [Actinomycetota bacterium]MCB9389203.1 hypothetical protein [Acidimicrobiia bacterium]